MTFSFLQYLGYALISWKQKYVVAYLQAGKRVIPASTPFLLSIYHYYELLYFLRGRYYWGQVPSDPFSCVGDVGCSCQRMIDVLIVSVHLLFCDLRWHDTCDGRVLWFLSSTTRGFKNVWITPISSSFFTLSLVVVTDPSVCYFLCAISNSFFVPFHDSNF